MPKVAFLDESKRGTYMVCAATVVRAELHVVRRALKGAKGKHHGIHMTQLNDAERMQLAQVVGDLGVEAYIFQARGGKDRDMRDRLLAEAATHLHSMGVAHLLVESCEQDGQDRRILRSALGPATTLAYGHGGKEELLLALPDIAAWCWGRGGKFKQAVKSFTQDLGVFAL